MRRGALRKCDVFIFFDETRKNGLICFLYNVLFRRGFFSLHSQNGVFLVENKFGQDVLFSLKVFM